MKEDDGYYDRTVVCLMKPVKKINLKSSKFNKTESDSTFITKDDLFNDLPIGILSVYADPQKLELEESAFEKAIVEKHCIDLFEYCD
jgi:hypothetical protein